MKWSNSYLSVCIVAIFVWLVEGSHHHCRSGEFFNRLLGECTECSSCPVNTIIRRPCHRDRNTQCGPFREFDKFHQGPSQTNILDLLDNKEKKMDAGKSAIKNVKTIDSDVPENPVEIVSDRPWYTIAMSLLGVLCFVSVFLGIYIIVACYICKRRREDKEIIYDAELQPQTPQVPHGNAYVQTYIPARDRLKQHTWSKTPDDSDDSGGAVPSQFLVLPPAGLQFTDTSDYDADSSGQTVSTGSTDYVYFKTNNAAKV